MKGAIAAPFLILAIGGYLNELDLQMVPEGSAGGERGDQGEGVRSLAPLVLGGCDVETELTGEGMWSREDQ